MSYTTMHLVPATGPIESWKEYRNSHRFAMVIWDSVSKRRNMTGPSPFGSGAMPIIMDDQALDRLWASSQDLDQPLFERALIALTFDHAMVKREDIGRLQTCIEEWCDVYGENSHLPAMSRDIEELKDPKFRPDVVAICITGTSVSGDVWYVFGDGADSDCEEEDPRDQSRPYDLSRDLESDDRHLWLFEYVERNGAHQ
jgi:hypothetical protein